jgi:hypothetical protein
VEPGLIGIAIARGRGGLKPYQVVHGNLVVLLSLCESLLKGILVRLGRTSMGLLVRRRGGSSRSLGHCEEAGTGEDTVRRTGRRLKPGAKLLEMALTSKSEGEGDDTCCQKGKCQSKRGERWREEVDEKKRICHPKVGN